MSIHRLGIAHLQIFGLCMRIGRGTGKSMHHVYRSRSKTLIYRRAKLLIALYLTRGIERDKNSRWCNASPSRGILNCQESLIHLGQILGWGDSGTWSSLCQSTAGHTPNCALFGDQERRESVNCTRSIPEWKYWDWIKKKKKKASQQVPKAEKGDGKFLVPATTIWHEWFG